MFSKPWLYALASVALLMGCASTQERTAQTGCTPGGNCWVEIRISQDCKTLTLTPPGPLEVPRRSERKHIHWEIKSENFMFGALGIAIRQPDGEFDERELDTNGKTFKWRDLHTKGGKYKYDINVIRTGANPDTCTFDPFIVNQ